jgi:hypothetical protein
MTLIRRQVDAGFSAGELEGLLVPWDTPATVRDSIDGPAYVESWAPGSLVYDDLVPVYGAHTHTDIPGAIERGPLIGRADHLEDGPHGLTGTIVLADTPAAREIRELARTVGAYLSIEVDTYDDEAPVEGSTVTRTRGLLTGLAVILPPHKPAFPSAAVTAVRSKGNPAMSETEPVDPDVETDDNDDDNDDTEAETAIVGRSAVAELVRAEVARTAVPRGRIAAHPLARFDRFVDAADAAFTDPAVAVQVARALADQVTTNNPGVIPPGWVKDVKGIIDIGRRVVSALGPNPDPGEGMEINWPYFAGNLLALVGVQATEKTAITSVRVDLLKGTAPYATYAGGSDISYQLIRRSSPSYRDAYLRIMSAAYAAVTDKAATDQLEVASNAGVAYDVATDTDGAAFRAAVFEASVEVEMATGSPASVVLAATDVFVKVGSLLVPAPVFNVGGTADAASLSVDVSKLQVVHAPALAPGTAIVTNRLAAAWSEDGPHTITADDVEKLGQNIAVWGLGALAAFYPNGVVTLNATGVPAVAEASSGRGSKKS